MPQPPHVFQRPADRNVSRDAGTNVPPDPGGPTADKGSASACARENGLDDRHADLLLFLYRGLRPSVGRDSPSDPWKQRQQQRDRTGERGACGDQRSLVIEEAQHLRLGSEIGAEDGFAASLTPGHPIRLPAVDPCSGAVARGGCGADAEGL